MSSILSAIRSATRDLHEELEAVLDIPRQVTTRAQYAELLRSFYAIYLPWEEKLAAHRSAFAAIGITLAPRLRVPRLERDLAALGEALPAPASPAALPASQDFPRALGGLYVLEGSTLGGQVLTRLFRERFGFGDESLHFFGSHGAEVGRFWKEFCAALEAFGAQASPEERAAVVDGARDGFLTVTRWFREHPVS